MMSAMADKDGVLDWIGLVARLIIGGMWTYAGALKITNLEANLVAVEAYQLPIPAGLEKAIGYAQPPIELAVGIMLLLGFFTRINALLTAIAMIAFIGGISWAWSKGLEIDCGCFSTGGELPPNVEPTYLLDILRDVGFLILAGYLIWRPHSKFALDNKLFPPIVRERTS